MHSYLLTTTFLLMLGLTTYSLFQERISSSLEERCYQGYMAAERKAHNKQAAKIFQKETKTLAKSRQKSLSPSYEKKERLSPRIKLPPRGHSQFNLYPLFFPEGDSYPLIYEAAARLLRILYQHTSVFGEEPPLHWEYQILDRLIEMGSSSARADLSTLFAQGDFLGQNELVYKMLKGTRSYCLREKKGYPPLTDYFVIARNFPQEVGCFPRLSFPVMEALFGAATAAKIHSEEKKKGSLTPSFLTREELSSLVKEEDLPLLSHLSFIPRKSPLDLLLVQDEQTGIAVKRKL